MFFSTQSINILFAFLPFTFAQQPDTSNDDFPSMSLSTCDSNGCVEDTLSAVLDQNWRWIHNSNSQNCYTGTTWNAADCPDGNTCAQNCILGAVDSGKYENTYGIKPYQNGVQLDFVTNSNVGSRNYLLDGSEYKIFYLLNKEFSMTVDVSQLTCGLNGAAYFVEMDGKGSMGKGYNNAGAAFGTGYCDAQCPQDVKFIDGSANIEGWDSTTATGGSGACCAEMDIWEANREAQAYTPHPCSKEGLYKCTGTDSANGEDDRYSGVCDKDGCDYNPCRSGDCNFYGYGSSFSVDSSKPLTIVTQFYTDDNTDTGTLSKIARYYVQDGNVIDNLNETVINQSNCDAQKVEFNETNAFSSEGGMKGMGEALGRGMVFVFSLWDDAKVDMLWLDSDYPTNESPSKPGVHRGPCPNNPPSNPRQENPGAYTRFWDLKYGDIGTTGGGSITTTTATTTSSHTTTTTTTTSSHTTTDSSCSAKYQ